MKGRSAPPSPVKKPVKREVVVRSEGQRQLVELGGSLSDIADVVGCTRQAVHQWRLGDLTPSTVMRGKLFAAFGIPAVAWGRQPGDDLNEPAQPPPAAPPAPEGPLDAAAECQALHASIRSARSRGGLTTAELIRLTDSETRLLTLRHRMEREAEMLEDRIIREHPKWALVKTTLMRAVAVCPSCTKRLLAELSRLGV